MASYSSSHSWKNFASFQSYLGFLLKQNYFWWEEDISPAAKWGIRKLFETLFLSQQK